MQTSRIFVASPFAGGMTSSRQQVQMGPGHGGNLLLHLVLLMVAGGTLPSGGRDSLNWQTDAVAWLSFIIIVVFLVAGIYFLTNMQFKKDSLLYGRAKAD